MQKERFWFGTSLVVIPALFFLMLIMPPMKAPRGGPLEGDVKIHGRPLAGGYILFVPDDSKAATAIGLIDGQGHYQIESRSLEEGAEVPTHFRIRLIANQDDDDVNHEIVSEPAPIRDAQSHAEANRPRTVTKVAAGLPRWLTDPRTSALQVQIGPEPTRVDITL